MPLGQRFPQFRNRVVGRSPSDYAKELQEYLYDVWRYTQGIPGGFLDTVATAIRAGVASTAGTVAASWAAADHIHNPETAAPSNPTGVTPSEGSGTALMRADATIEDIVLATAALSPNGYVLQSNSGQALGIEWVPGLSRTETEVLISIVERTTGSGSRSARSRCRSARCQRTGNCCGDGDCSGTISSRGARA